MKTRNKIMLLALCMAALIAVSVLGTMAYLTSTDTVTNTFTVGKVAITLDERKVNTDGSPVTPDEYVKANSYKLIPGRTNTKDPTVTVLPNSEESYVRMVVTVTFKKTPDEKINVKDIDDIFRGYNGNAWNQTSTTVSDDRKVVTYVYDYKEPVSTDATAKKLPALFTSVEIPGEWTQMELNAIGNFEIKIVAQAIQTDGFNDSAAAWKSFNGGTGK